MLSSLRSTIIGILAIGAVAQGLYLIMYIQSSERQDIRNQVRQELKYISANLQGTTNFLLRRNNIDQVQEQISELGTNTNLRYALLVDSNEAVIASTKLAFVSENVWDLLLEQGETELSAIKERVMGKTASVWSAITHDAVFSMYPVLEMASQQHLRSFKQGFLLIKYDLGEPISKARGLFYRIMVLQVFGLVLIGFLLHYFVSRRIVLVEKSMLSVNQGQYNISIPVSGDDELGRLARSVENMASQFQKGQLEQEQQKTRIQGLLDTARRSEETYAKAEAIAHIGSWDWDIVTGALHWSDEIFRVFGLKPQEFGATYEAFLEYIHPDDRILVTSAVDASVADPSVPYNIEHRLLLKDNSVRHVQEQGKVYYDEDDKAVRMIGTVMDITDRKNVEVELKKHREKLEELVKVRTLELESAQEDLIRNERLATLGQLTATVSHELRNPLGAMAPSLYVIKKQVSSEELKIQQSIDRIERNVMRCDRIIDELLDFTRITSINLIEGQLDPWLEEVLSEQEIPFGIKLTTLYELVDTWTGFDSDLLRRAVINVVENACHAMLDESGQNVIDGAQLKVSTHLSEQRIEIRVEDNGMGIQPEVLKRIFEPLYSTKGFGVGLGMPTVKQIMEQHRGGIDIVTEEKIGTLVTLWLPLDKVVVKK